MNIIYRRGGGVVYNGDSLPEKVLIRMGEAYLGPPPKNTRTDGKSGEVSVLVAGQSLIREV